MEHAYVHLLHLLAGHPAWTLTVVFLAAFLEAIAVIGTFFPGNTAMFLAGAVVGTWSLNLGWVLAWAIAGAVAGDGMSYWLGSRYKDRIVQVWPFRTHPQVLDAGHSFFEKHGAKSVVFARFIGRGYRVTHSLTTAEPLTTPSHALIAGRLQIANKR
jgi:membrane protein DedA with SNARE-associated domain